MLYKIAIITLFILIIMLPAILHADTYRIINNDTANHLAIFDMFQAKDYSNYHYGGQIIIGWIVNTLYLIGIEKWITFMVFNFGILVLAGLSVGFMVYRLTGSMIGGLISMFIITFGTGATMHLFYCGTIFNLAGILVIVPLFIILGHYLITNRRYIILGITAVPLIALAIYWHPSIGYGVLFALEGIGLANINPFEMLSSLYGVLLMILLIVSGIQILYADNFKMERYTKAVLICLGIGFVTLTGIAMMQSYVVARVMINAVLFLSLITVIIYGIACKYSKGRYQYVMIGVGVVSISIGIYDWISNIIIKGVPASAMLS